MTPVAERARASVAARAVPAPARRPEPQVRPPLSVLPRGYRSPRARRRRRRLVLLLCVMGAVAALFGLVLVHVELTSNQLRLVALQQQVDAQQQRHLKLRLQVAQLESPARIVADAQQLGMVPPATITYLAAVPDGTGAPGTGIPGAPGPATPGSGSTPAPATTGTPSASTTSPAPPRTDARR